MQLQQSQHVAAVSPSRLHVVQLTYITNDSHHGSKRRMVSLLKLHETVEICCDADRFSLLKSLAEKLQLVKDTRPHLDKVLLWCSERRLVCSFIP